MCYLCWEEKLWKSGRCLYYVICNTPAQWLWPDIWSCWRPVLLGLSVLPVCLVVKGVSLSPLSLLAWEKCWSISYHASLIGGNEAAESKMNILGSSSPFNLIFQTLGQRVFKETSDLLSATNILTTLGFGKKKLLLFSRRSQTMCDFVGTAHAPNSMLPGFFTCNRSPLHNVQENEQLWEKCTSDTIQSCL